MKWFRLYHDLPHDRKLRKFSSQQKWAWVVLLCLASESKQRGQIIGEDDDILAEDCGFESCQDFMYFVDKLRQQGMIEPISNGYKITNWDERQFISDDVTARTSASKTKKKERSQEQKRNVPRNRKGTPSDTDAEYQSQISDPEQEIIDPVLNPHTHGACAQNEESVGNKLESFSFWTEPEEQPKQQEPNQPSVNQNPKTSNEASQYSAAPQERESFSKPSEVAFVGAVSKRRLSNIEKTSSEWWGRWRIGNGPNQWHEGFVDWMTHNWIQGKKRDRCAVIGYLVNCEADYTGAALQKIEAYFDAYEASWEAQTGHSSDQKWLANAAHIYSISSQAEDGNAA